MRPTGHHLSPTFTGGFDHTIERKHRDPFRGRIFALHIFTCNSPPEIPERVTYDPAFWGRWIYLHFENVFDTDPDFMGRWVTPANLSGFLNRVIQTMIRIKRDGLIVAPDESMTKEAWTLAADPLAWFIKEEMIPSKDERYFEKEPLLKTFIRWCEAHLVASRKIPVTLIAFTTMAFKNQIRTTQHDRRQVYGARYTWRPGSEYEPTRESRAAGVNLNLDP